MILKYKYHSDSGLLEAYRSYTLAQNNSLSDTIEITSTSQDAERYNYCLEFICYNSKSIPKAQYISPILNYTDGCISFAIPNNLTEFRGHVDMQLTGYDPEDNSIVFKSISKNCKAFDVEGSLCVLEKDLNDTPNVFTEVLKQLEDLKNIHQDIIDEAMSIFEGRIFEKVAKYKWCKVRFYDNGNLIEEKLVIEGSKLVEPKYTLPQYCILAGGWYNPATESLWNLDENVVQGDTELYLNYKTDDIQIVDGVVTDFGKHFNTHLYVPEYYEGFKVTALDENLKALSYQVHVHLGNNMENFQMLLTHQNVYGLYFPSNNENIISKDGYLYVKQEGFVLLAFVPKYVNISYPAIMDGCSAINSMAINNNTNIERIIFPESLTAMLSQCIYNTILEELTIPRNVNMIEEYAVVNNKKLKKVIFEGDCPNTLNANTFVNIDSSGNVTHPVLYVLPQYYENFKARGCDYQIEVLGQDYFDGKYAPIGE